jgi:hypothetical protein
MALANTLAYYENNSTITTVKNFIEQGTAVKTDSLTSPYFFK